MYVEKHDAVNNPMFFNIAEGGNVINYWKGKERDKETKKKISENNGMKGNGHLLKGMFSGKKNPIYGHKRKPPMKVLMLDLDFNVLQEFESMTSLWKWCLKEFNDDRGPATKDRLYIRGRQIYRGKYYFCKASEVEDFLKEKKRKFIH
ncbi:hypothetical protein [Bacillus nitratireducens]|uniref:hypothetical protein n=1 Tax=Bacillus nitratireducens TaxID=2026193 RepID=UPI00399CDB23